MKKLILLFFIFSHFSCFAQEDRSVDPRLDSLFNHYFRLMDSIVVVSNNEYKPNVFSQEVIYFMLLLSQVSEFQMDCLGNFSGDVIIVEADVKRWQRWYGNKKHLLKYQKIARILEIYDLIYSPFFFQNCFTLCEKNSNCDDCFMLCLKEQDYYEEILYKEQKKLIKELVNEIKN